MCWSRGGGPIGDDEPDPSRDAPHARYTAIAWDMRYVGGLVPSGHYTCALTEEGAIVCWGLEGSDFDQALFPPDPPRGSYTAIRMRHDSPGLGAHFLRACALADAGDLVCWGSGRGHLTPYGPGTSRLSGDYALVGDLFCDRSGAGEPSSLVNDWCRQSAGDDAGLYVAVSPGEFHTCAITGSGTVICEADRSSISSDVSGALSVMTPPEPSPSPYVAVSTGEWLWISRDQPPLTYACALAESGTAVCWESVPNKVDRPEPPSGPYVAVSDGLGHTCALTAEREAVCWGWNNFGQSQVPSGRYTTISAGHGSTWAITDEGGLVRWGGNSPPWRPPPAAEPYVEVTAGDFDGACALAASGEVVCWPEETDLPQGLFENISLGWGGHGCALSESREVVCFSRYWARWSGACGGSRVSGCWFRTSREEATHAPPPGPYRMVSVGQFHACGVTDAGTVACWDHERVWPPYVPAGTYVAVAAGLYHDCALTETGEAHCRGTFSSGKLGAFDYGPVDPPPGRYQAITSGHARARALTEAGEVVCWGDTDYQEWPTFWRPWEE